MLDFFIAPEDHPIREASLPRRLSLEGAVYWFLHRYFVQAALDPSDFNFLNLYEDTEIRGCQLHRLATEMKEALADIGSRQSSFSILVGWTSQNKSETTEEFQSVEKADIERATKKLLSLAIEAQHNGLVLHAIGD